MTLPWSKFPRVLRGSPRFTRLRPNALAAYLLAWSSADDDGIIQPSGASDAIDALVEELAMRLPSAPMAWAHEAVREIIDAGLLDSLDDGNALQVVDWIPAGASAPAVVDAPADVPFLAPQNTPQRPPAPANDRTPAAKKGRPTKGAAAMSASERSRRLRFERRISKESKGVPEGVTYEEFMAARGNETHPTEAPAGNEKDATATKLGNETRQRKSVGNESRARAVSETSGSSGTSEPERTEKTQSESGTREPATATKLGNETRQRNSLGAGGNESRPRLAYAEHTSPFATAEVLAAMREASGGLLATHVQGAQTAAMFEEWARTLVAREVTTTDGFASAAKHALHDEWVSKRGPFDLATLLLNDGKIITGLIAGALGCKECGGALAANRPGPKRASDDPATIELHERDAKWQADMAAKAARKAAQAQKAAAQ